MASVVCLEAQGPPTMVPPVRGTHEMVAAANSYEVEAGYRILTQGGNAIDAGVASVLAASVTEPPTPTMAMANATAANPPKTMELRRSGVRTSARMSSSVAACSTG